MAFVLKVRNVMMETMLETMAVQPCVESMKAGNAIVLVISIPTNVFRRAVMDCVLEQKSATTKIRNQEMDVPVRAWSNADSLVIVRCLTDVMPNVEMESKLRWRNVMMEMK